MTTNKMQATKPSPQSGGATPATNPQAMAKTNGTAPAAVEPKKKTLQEFIEAKRPSIASVLPKGLDPERIIRIALVSVAKDKTGALQKATFESILIAIMNAAELGLEPGGVMAEGYLIAYNITKERPDGTTYQVPEAQFQPSALGLLKLARQSGQVRFVRAEVVYENDLEFEIAYHLDPPFKHRPHLDGDPGKLLGAYCYIALKDGGGQFAWLNKADIDKIRAASKSKNSGPWVDWYPAMAKKSAVRACVKLCDKSVLPAKAIEAIDRDFEFSKESAIEATTVDRGNGKGAKALKARLVMDQPQSENPAPPVAQESEPMDRDPGMDDGDPPPPDDVPLTAGMR